MGLLVDGQWQDQWYNTRKSGGRFKREASAFRNWITADGAPGPSGMGGFKAEPGRYHLYVSYACPWAHRTLILRQLKGLGSQISVDVVHPFMGSEGWSFNRDAPGATGDSLQGKGHLHEIYTSAKSDYTGRVTVPVLWDKERRTIVSNESSEIIRMLNSAFTDVGATGPDLYPAHDRDRIDAINDTVYANVNNGVYRCGFATTQAAYEEAFRALFETLDDLDARLASSRFLTGDEATEADWRLFTTLVRFDAVYHGHFKCNLRRIADYAHLAPYVRDLFQTPGVEPTVRLDHIKQHYYSSHTTINPTGIVPVGPSLNFSAPHGRETLTE